MNNLLLVFLGGGIGAALRYWLSGVVYRSVPGSFPYGTMFVNVTGCFLIGFLMASLSNRFALNPGLMLFLTIGVLGGFTTYSTFSYETIVMLREAQRLAALSNITFTLLSCLTGTWLGMETGQLF